MRLPNRCRCTILSSQDTSTAGNIPRNVQASESKAFSLPSFNSKRSRTDGSAPFAVWLCFPFCGTIFKRKRRTLRGKERMDMAKYPLIVLLCFLGAMMLFQPELLCKLISFFVVKNSEPSDYRLSFVRLRGLFCLIAALLLALFL